MRSVGLKGKRYSFDLDPDILVFKGWPGCAAKDLLRASRGRMDLRNTQDPNGLFALPSRTNSHTPKVSRSSFQLAPSLLHIPLPGPPLLLCRFTGHIYVTDYHLWMAKSQPPGIRIRAYRRRALCRSLAAGTSSSETCGRCFASVWRRSWGGVDTPARCELLGQSSHQAN